MKEFKISKTTVFIKVRRNLTDCPEMADIMAEEGSTGFGTYLIILMYLASCDNGVGNYNTATLKVLAAKAHKSIHYIRHIINDYHLFKVDAKQFESKMIVNSFHFKSTLNEKEGVYNKNAQCAREKDKDKDKEINNPPTTSSDNKEIDGDDAGRSFSLLRDKISDDGWLKGAGELCGLPFADNPGIRLKALEWFRINVKAKSKHLKDAEDAGAYFVSLFRKGLETRRLFDEYCHRGDNGEQARMSGGQPAARPLLTLEHRMNGRRYCFHDYPVAWDAPMQTNPDELWSWRTKKWIHISRYDYKAEKAAFLDQVAHNRKNPEFGSR